MKKDGLFIALVNSLILSVIIIAATVFVVYEKKWVGLVFIIIGFLHLLVLKIFNISVKSVWPDLVFGAIDNGILVIAAIIGADFAGVLGAIVGGSAANAITDGFAGIFEGWTAEYLRKNKIKEKRTALGSALGKMAGCLFGAGLVLLIAWGIF